MLRSPRLVMLLALLAAASPAVGQPGQYSAPGTLGAHPIDARLALRAAIEEARWKLGPVRIDPWLGVRDIAWVKEADQKSDLTVSVGAGLRAYLPVGARLVFAAHALPEYIWWRDRDEGSRVGGRAGLGLFYHANRFGLELRARSSDLDAYVTPEVQRRAPVDSRTVDGRLDVPLGRRFALFASGSRGVVRVDDEDPAFSDLSNLDSTTTLIEGGVRILVTRDLSIGVGVGSSETAFDRDALDRSNDGSFIVYDIAWTRPKLGASLKLRQYRLDATASSEFGSFDGETWTAQISWQPRRALALAAYAQNEIVYSVLGDVPYFEDGLVGLRIGLTLGSRLSLGAFVEDGIHDYSDGRSDDVRSWGGSVGGPLYRRLRFELGSRTTEIDGALGRREVREVGWRISLGTDGLSWF